MCFIDLARNGCGTAGIADSLLALIRYVVRFIFLDDMDVSEKTNEIGKQT